MFLKRMLIVPAGGVIWLLALSQHTLLAQGWQWQNPLPQGDNLNLVTFVDRDHGWITSDGPILLRTRNGGTNWEILRTGVAFTDIHFINSLEGWGIGNPRFDVDSWSIYHTIDGGATWEVQLANVAARYDIFFLDALHGWAANDKMIPIELLFTRNGGKTWEPQARGEFRLNDEIHGIMFINLLKGWVVGFTGGKGAIRTKDGGTTWERDSTLVGVRQLFFADSLHGWGRHGSRWIFRTIDGGEKWERIQVTDTFGEVRSNHFFAFDTSRCFVALNVGLYASTDGGQSWMLHSPQELTSFAFLDSMEAWGVVDNKLLHSTDGGRSWQNLTKDILPDGATFFSSVDFVNTRVGWVAGLNVIVVGFNTVKNGVILKTIDGGITWTQQFSRSGMSFGDIVFVDQLRGWGVGSGGHIFYTSDGGETWQQQNSGTDFILREVKFVDDRHGWVVGDKPVENKGIILHTSDGGTTWLDQTPMGTPPLSAVTFIDTLNGWVVGKVVLRTKDGGQTWITQRQGTGLGAVTFTDTLHGWASGFDPQTEAIIIHTNDGGMTWIPQLAGPYHATDIKFVDSLHGWAVNLFGRVYYTMNGGNNWREQQSYTSRSLRAIDFIDAKHGWIVGDHGIILHTNNGGITTVKQNLTPSKSPKSFVLHDNYPNPFNAQTKIRFEILESRAKVRLAIYNLYGQLVAQLMDEERTAGVHEVAWNGMNDDGTASASGLYFYRLEVNGAVQVGKAVLIK